MLIARFSVSLCRKKSIYLFLLVVQKYGDSVCVDFLHPAGEMDGWIAAGGGTAVERRSVQSPVSEIGRIFLAGK